MIVDALELPHDATLTGDVVIVGAGPAGIVTSLELAAAGLDVVLLESGGLGPDDRIQALGDSELVDERRHSPSAITTRRQVGGTSVIWGGRCVPFDPIDFDRRDCVPDSTWPVAYEGVQRYFERACKWLVCGRPVFDAAQVPGLAPLVPGLPDGPVRTDTLERWSLPTDFGREYRQALLRSERVRLVTSATCTEIVCAEDARRVDHLVARPLDGRRLIVRGRRYVVACGGLETTRLLLSSQTPDGRPIGDHSDHLGHWYMAHVEGGIARAHFHTPPRLTQYSYARDVDGVYIRRRISLARTLQRQEALPNVVSWLANPDLPDPAHRSGPLSFAYLALSSPAGRSFAPDAQRRSLTGEHVPGAPYGATEKGTVREHLRNLIDDRAATLRFVADFGFNRFLPHRRAPGFFAYNPTNEYPLQYHGEHLPRRDSRVTLSKDSDRLGMRKLRIDLRFSDADVDGVIRAHERWDAHLRANGVGHLEYRSQDPTSAVWEHIGGGFHQSGTTRMSARADDGVVDSDLAVHGFSDLFAVSSSTFVTSSQANSTMMIVVFALRLADHLIRVNGA